MKHAPDAAPGTVCQVSWTACGKWQYGTRSARFTALLHHVSVHRLMRAFDDLKKGASPGVDGVTWHAYEQDLQENLRDLHERVQSGALPG